MTKRRRKMVNVTTDIPHKAGLRDLVAWVEMGSCF